MKEVELRDSPSLAMLLVNSFQLLYVTDALWNEVWKTSLVWKLMKFIYSSERQISSTCTTYTFPRVCRRLCLLLWTLCMMDLGSCWRLVIWPGFPSHMAFRPCFWLCTHSHLALLEQQGLFFWMVNYSLFCSYLSVEQFLTFPLFNLFAGIGYFIFRKSNSQKNQFRRDPTHKSVQREWSHVCIHGLRTYYTLSVSNTNMNRVNLLLEDTIMASRLT